MTRNMDQAQRLQFEVDVAPPQEQESKRDEMNRQAMRQLGAMGMPPPPKPPVKRG